MGDDWPSSFDQGRRTVYEYMTLTFTQRLKIAVDLQLIRDEDQDVTKHELFRRAIQRAREGDLMTEILRRSKEVHNAS